MVAKAPGAHQTGHHLGQRPLGWAPTLRKQGGLGWGREVGLGGGHIRHCRSPGDGSGLPLSPINT